MKLHFYYLFYKISSRHLLNYIKSIIGIYLYLQKNINLGKGLIYDLNSANLYML